MEAISADGARGDVDLAGLLDDLIRVETELWNRVEAELRSAHDLPLSWYEPMQVVRRTPACRVVDIAEALSITVGGTSKLVDRMAAAAMLVRAPNPDDGRSSVIELTDDGRQRLTAAQRTFDEALGRLVGGALSPRQVAQLGGALRQLRRSLHDGARSR